VTERLPPGYVVLVTRPRDQAHDLADEIRRRGGTPLMLPVIEILPRPRDAVATDAAALPAADISIFISRNAVAHGLDFAGGLLAAIGPSTAAELRRRGHTADVQPAQGFDSESLLAEPAFADVRGLHIRILRGDPGREVLAGELLRRGAHIDYLQVYSRGLPQYTGAQREELARQFRAASIGAVVVMSVEALDNLAQVAPAAFRLGPGGPLLVTPAARVLKEVQLRYPDWPTELAAGPRTDELVDAIVARAATTGSDPQPD
jgi:uroporphyrinogen-III synthase